MSGARLHRAARGCYGRLELAVDEFGARYRDKSVVRSRIEGAQPQRTLGEVHRAVQLSTQT